MKHKLKIWPQYYCRVADGSKTFEVRNNDRGFQPGDEVALREWKPAGEEYKMGNGDYMPPGAEGFTSNPTLTFRIGYVLPIDAERVVFSLLPLTTTPNAGEGNQGGGG